MGDIVGETESPDANADRWAKMRADRGRNLLRRCGWCRWLGGSIVERGEGVEGGGCMKASRRPNEQTFFVPAINLFFMYEKISHHAGFGNCRAIGVVATLIPSKD